MIKIITFAFAFIFSLNIVFAWTSYNIVGVDSGRQEKIKITLDSEIKSESDKISWELKILKDIKLSPIEKLSSDKKVIKIKINWDLEKTSSYSILSISWVKWDMDFSLNEDSIWKTIKNSNTKEDIDYIKIIDSNTIEVYFKNEITSSNIEIKFYKNLQIDKINLNLLNKKEINVSLKNNLEENSSYLLMVFSLKTDSAQDIVFWEWLYDFNTIIFNNTPEKVSTWKIIDEKNPNSVENVASKVKETPATWPETWLLLFSTIIISMIIFFRRKTS